MAGDTAQRGLVVVDDVDAAEERLHGQAAAVARASCGAARGSSRRIVAEADRAVRTDEDGTCVAHAGGDVGCVAGLDLEVLGGIRVDDVEPRVDVVDEDDARLCALEGLGDAFGVLRGRDASRERPSGGLGELLAVGDEDRCRERVVLGLADEVAATWSGSAESSARMAISVGPASASMPMSPLRRRLAATTQMLPGPVTSDTGSQTTDSPSTEPHSGSSSTKPCANMATAWAPPTAYTSSTPSRAHAARIVGLG